MKNSPLQLKHYLVVELSVKALPPPATKPNPNAKSTFKVSTQVTNAKNRENLRDWKVCLKVTGEPEEPALGGYLVAVELIGFFEVLPEFPEDKIEDLVTANAPALLYGAARELVLLVTARGPYSPFVLPSASFCDEAPTSRKVAPEKKANLAKPG